jgi:hypothetical protein
MSVVAGKALLLRHKSNLSDTTIAQSSAVFKTLTVSYGGRS